MIKNDKDEECPKPVELRNQHSNLTQLNSGNSIVLQNNKKTKQHLMWS